MVIRRDEVQRLEQGLRFGGGKPGRAPPSGLCSRASPSAPSAASKPPAPIESAPVSGPEPVAESRRKPDAVQNGRRPWLSPWRPTAAWLVAGLFALAAVVAVPIALDAGHRLGSEDDPAAVADLGLERTFDRDLAIREIEAALAANDPDLAGSFVELAQDRNVALPAELTGRVKSAVERANSAVAHVESFARGLITGEPDNMAGLAGTTVGDLFVFGDIRDAAREGARYIAGQETDELVLGLAVVGLAITAGTYATAGAATPARIGLSVAKAARRTGRISAGMAAWLGRSLREVVDWSALKRAGASVTDPAAAVRAARQVVRPDKADDLMRLAGDIGRVQGRAGTQAALDGLKVALGPRDMARVARLAEKKGGKTRAILKTLGRGAIFLSLATFNLAAWILGAILTLFGFVSSAKAGVERLTQRAIDRGKARRLARYEAMTGQRA